LGVLHSIGHDHRVGAVEQQGAATNLGVAAGDGDSDVAGGVVIERTDIVAQLGGDIKGPV